MGELKNIFSKLNIMEQVQLNKYINREINKTVMSNQVRIDEEVEAAQKELDKREQNMKEYYIKANDETWHRIETLLHIAMREHHISEERIKKIDARVNEISKEHNGEILLGEERKSEYKVLEDADFQRMIELLLDSNCKNCHIRHNKCEVYELLKKYNIPHEGKGKCKYAYFKIGKKVV